MLPYTVRKRDEGGMKSDHGEGLQQPSESRTLYAAGWPGLGEGVVGTVAEGTLEGGSFQACWAGRGRQGLRGSQRSPAMSDVSQRRGRAGAGLGHLLKHALCLTPPKTGGLSSELAGPLLAA